jgi:hypothetical protein
MPLRHVEYASTARHTSVRGLSFGRLPVRVVLPLWAVLTLTLTSFLLASSALIVVLAGNARLSAMLAARTIASAVDDLLDLAPRATSQRSTP